MAGGAAATGGGAGAGAGATATGGGAGVFCEKKYAAAPPPARTTTATVVITTRVRLRLCRVSSARLATVERRSSFFSPVVSSPLMLRGIAPVGSTPPPSGSPSTRDFAPSAAAPCAAAGFCSGARAAISSFASAASADAPAGFQVTSAPGAGVCVGFSFSLTVSGSVRNGCGSPWGRGAGVRAIGARYPESSATPESGCQSPIPGRHTSESGPTSPASHFRFTSASGNGPTCAWPIATYHSVGAGSGAAATLARSSTPIAWVAPGSGAAAVAAGLSPNALSKAWPSSASSPGAGAPPSPAAGAGAAAAATAGTSAARRTTITFPHFLQRTLTPFGPTFSSEIMYWALQLSQVNFIGRPS